MIRRLKRYIIYKFLGYIPGTSKLASMEAKRLTQYVFDNFPEHQQLIFVTEIKKNLIEMRENQIKNEELKLIQLNSNLKGLTDNLSKLQEIK